MKIIEDISLQSYNTFNVESRARQMVQLETYSDLPHFQHQLRSNEYEFPFQVIGGGSNMLFKSSQIDQTLIQNQIKGRTVVHEADDEVIIKFGGGEDWHEIVMWTVDKSYFGIENLALIPGSVGAAPVQNIGAYGVELADVFHSLEALELDTGNVLTFSKADCVFSYRNSYFKKHKNRYLILSVCLQFQTNQFEPVLTYKALSDYLDQHLIESPDQRDIADAVIDIRSSKLPNPDEIGNAGSFFKNPVIDTRTFDSLHNVHPKMPYYVVDDEHVKIPAAWLIDQCGWKGYRREDIGIYPKQALVIVNYGDHTTGSQIMELAFDIVQSVEKKFNITLEPEVNIITS